MGSSTTIYSVSDFISAIHNWGPGVYRGQHRDGPDWQLLPKIARPPCMERVRKRYPNIEEDLLKRFRLFAAPYIDSLTDMSPAVWWRCLCIAQHHGLPTRLLDWTRDPLSALYFATEAEDKSATRVVYHLPTAEVLTPSTPDEFANCQPEPWKYDAEDVRFLQPELTNPRVYAQGSVFSVHPGNPVREGFLEQKVNRVLIETRTNANNEEEDRVVTQIRTDLYRLGVTRAKLFADTDAVAKTVFLEYWWELVP